MALSDRALPGSIVAAYRDGASWADFASSKTVTVAGTTFALDPIVSGTSASLYIPKGGAGSITFSIPALNTLTSFTIEAYLHFGGSATGTVLKLGASPILSVNSAGYISVTPPYTTATPVDIDYQPFSSTQLSIVCDGENWSVLVNGTEMTSGQNTSGFSSATSVVFDNDTNVSKAIGAFLLLDKASTTGEIQRRASEAVFRTDAADMYFYAQRAVVSERNQSYQSLYDFPRHIAWSETPATGTTVDSNGIGLALQKIEEYSSYGCYYIDSLGDHVSSSGSIYVRIPSYATSAGNRGVIHIRRKDVASDTHTIKLVANQLQYIKKLASHDATGADTSANQTPVNLGSVLTNGASVIVGLVWDSQGLRAVRDSVSYSLSGFSGADFSPAGFSVYFGVDENLANPYHASQAAWNWEARVWDYADETVTASDYGTHTFFMSSTAALPVRGEGTVTLEAPIWSSTNSGDELARTPYMWYDGGPASVTGSLI